MWFVRRNKGSTNLMNPNQEQESRKQKPKIHVDTKHTILKNV